jgi:hypothetical protein
LTIAGIAARLKKEGIPVAVIDLFDLVLELPSSAVEKLPLFTDRS